MSHCREKKPAQNNFRKGNRVRWFIGLTAKHFKSLRISSLMFYLRLSPTSYRQDRPPVAWAHVSYVTLLRPCNLGFRKRKLIRNTVTRASIHSVKRDRLLIQGLSLFSYIQSYFLPMGGSRYFE